MKTKTITFICTGNICRSAAAEAILCRMLKDAGITDVVVNSFGTENVGVQPRDGVMAQVAMKRGYLMEGESTYRTTKALASSDLILCMAFSHVTAVQNLLPNERWDRIKLFNAYCFSGDEMLRDRNVEDPSFQSEYVYTQCFLHLERGCRFIANHLKLSHGD